MSSTTFNPSDVDLSTADPAQVVCYLELGHNKYDGRLGLRISALFVILVVSSAVTFFPVLATRVKKLRIPLYVYLFARYFGSGVIVATAFVHLLDPAYGEIGPNTCVGMTGKWAVYSWPPAIAMASAASVFVLDCAAERFVETKYGLAHGSTAEEIDQTQMRSGSMNAAMLSFEMSRRVSRLHTHQVGSPSTSNTPQVENPKDVEANDGSHEVDSVACRRERMAETGFRQQIAAFLILEFGVIFHSVIIGLTLGTAGSEFDVLYPVIVFHQSFEGLGIGARLSAIPFPRRVRWMPWALCAGYGLTTPIAIAIGLGLRNIYNGNSFTANIVSGILDATSAGILLWTGLVELLARDFLFNPERTKNDRQLTFMICSVLLGAGLMALLGKWA